MSCITWQYTHLCVCVCVCVSQVGYLYDATGSWDYALFLPSALFMVAGAYAYIFHASNERIEFDRLVSADTHTHTHTHTMHVHTHTRARAHILTYLLQFYVPAF